MAFLAHLLSALVPLLALIGCAQPRVNPSFDVSRDDAKRAMYLMRETPRRLDRPLVILGGFGDPGVGTTTMLAALRRVFDDDRIVVVTFAECTSFARCGEKVVNAVQKAFPTDDPNHTVEVDVIGMSMGGLVARVAADMGEPGARRLKIARLFTVSSPLQGAELARFPIVLTSIHRDMREGSELLNRLNETAPVYSVYSYTRLRDDIVGEQLAAPAGQTPWWVDGSRLANPHWFAMLDPRILADIARRLRGEAPFAREPRAPLPDKS
jgi:hypothetical protein